MTTLPMQIGRSGAESVFHKLTAVQTRRWTLRVLTAAAVTATFFVSALLVVSAVAGYAPGAAALRWSLRLALVAIAGFAGVWFLGRAIIWRQNPAQTARFVEQHLPELHNELINVVLLAGDREQADDAFVEQAIREAVGRTGKVDLEASISTRPLRKAGLALALAGTLLAAFAALQPGPFRRGLRAVLLGPEAKAGLGAAQAANIDLQGVAPGDAAVFPGDRVQVDLLVGGPDVEALSGATDAESPIAELTGRLDAHIETGDGRTIPLGDPRLRPGGVLKLSGLLAEHAKADIEYAVTAGGQRLPARPGAFYRLSVLRVEGLDITTTYPEYLATGDGPETLRDASEEQRHLRLPVGTGVALSLRVSAPVPAAALRLNDERLVMRPTPGGRALRASFPVTEDATYRIEVYDSDGDVRLAAPSHGGAYTVTAVADEPPRIAFQAPGRDVPASPGDALETIIAASDDHGLAEVVFHAGPKGGEMRPVETFRLNGRASRRIEYAFPLPPAAKMGDVYVYYATATDNRRLRGMGPQTRRTDNFEIHVQDADRLAARKAERYDELRRRLLAILRQQQTQRLSTAMCLRGKAKLAEVTRLGGEIVRGQERIKSALRELALEFPFDSEMVAIRQAVADLAVDEAQLAVDQAKVVAGLDALTGRADACGPLAQTQDDIIDAIERLLAVMPSMAGRKEHPDAPGGDLPPEVQDKLRELKAALEQFAEEESKVLEATDRLAKTPVDDFTNEDRELLEALKAVQDKWEKFLNEQLTDFSKLAEQDFSNPAMLEELMSVRNDVTMAKDALEKPAAEIATAFEDNGIENAEELTANIEKWLPDEPDREKWTMEAPPEGQELIEQPELPTELEDLVGELLEQEEELFEEMEDVTSTYLASFDKGAGWDAMDGPISNMNAQGVTGNQLPNDNELTGRSGEGRSGRSSGEFVQDEAVGKGGRRTPTRLTDDPFQQGQVKDSSTDPPGGATGGGKVSGAGAEGLEGRVPAPLQRELERLAGKQASILSRAEQLEARFSVGDYSHFRFLEAITLMNRVRDDLEQYRYRNALRRRRQAVGVLRQTHLMLSGEADVTVDASRTMPKRSRDDIADAEAAELPAAYRDALQEYYRRLSESAE